jgi:hypothetical protein
MSRAATKRKTVPAKREDWGQLSPEMRALPNDSWRTFVHELVTGPPGHGRLVRAARIAGFGKDSTPENAAKIAWRMSQDERTIAAVAPESRKYFRSLHPEALTAYANLLRDPLHKDHGRAVMRAIESIDPIVSKQDISVTHRIVDPDAEALEELRALRQIGATREKLVELFGGNGLARLERLEAADIARRSAEARVIDADAIEVHAHG